METDATRLHEELGVFIVMHPDNLAGLPGAMREFARLGFGAVDFCIDMIECCTPQAIDGVREFTRAFSSFFEEYTRREGKLPFTCEMIEQALLVGDSPAKGLLWWEESAELILGADGHYYPCEGATHFPYDKIREPLSLGRARDGAPDWPRRRRYLEEADAFLRAAGSPRRWQIISPRIFYTKGRILNRDAREHLETFLPPAGPPRVPRPLLEPPRLEKNRVRHVAIGRRAVSGARHGEDSDGGFPGKQRDPLAAGRFRRRSALEKPVHRPAQQPPRDLFAVSRSRYGAGRTGPVAAARKRRVSHAADHRRADSPGRGSRGEGAGAVSNDGPDGVARLSRKIRKRPSRGRISGAQPVPAGECRRAFPREQEMTRLDDSPRDQHRVLDAAYRRDRADASGGIHQAGVGLDRFAVFPKHASGAGVKARIVFQNHRRGDGRIESGPSVLNDRHRGIGGPAASVGETGRRSRSAVRHNGGRRIHGRGEPLTGNGFVASPA